MEGSLTRPAAQAALSTARGEGKDAPSPGLAFGDASGQAALSRQGRGEEGEPVCWVEMVTDSHIG